MYRWNKYRVTFIYMFIIEQCIGKYNGNLLKGEFAVLVRPHDFLTWLYFMWFI